MLQATAAGLLLSPIAAVFGKAESAYREDAGADSPTLDAANSSMQSKALAEELSRLITGTVHARGHKNYELKRTDVWSQLIPARFPQVIVTASSVDDITSTVKYAAEHGIKVAIRGGGHNWSVSSLRDESILIDLGQLREISIDPATRQAVISPGVSSAALVQASGQHGLGFPVAHCPSVPLSGFLLNGGFGWNTNAWGTAAAHIEEMSIVTANGDLVKATKTENSELFWAARGSGPGFFGIVVAFRINLRPLPKAIYASNFIVPLSMARELAAWVDAKRNDIPVNVELSYLTARSGGPPEEPGIAAVSAVAFRDTESDALNDLKFLNDFPFAEKALVNERSVSSSFEELLDMTAMLFPPGLRYLGNTHWTDNPLEAIYPDYAKHLGDSPSPHAFSNCVMYPTNSPDMPDLPDAAVSMQKQVLCLHYAVWEDESMDPVNHAWFMESDKIFQPHSKGHYIGETDLNIFPENASGSYSKAAWERLQALRNRHDPEGIFYDYLKGDAGESNT